MRPLLMLDIDGVLAPFNMEVPPNGFELVRPEGSPVSFYFSHELGRKVAALADDLEIVWASRWERYANEIMSPLLGLGELETISFRFRLAHRGAPETEPDWTRLHRDVEALPDYDPNFDHTSKLHNVSAFAGDRPAVWVDDELGRDAYLWAERRPSPTLLVHTDPARGLTDDQLEEIHAFARGLREKPGAVG